MNITESLKEYIKKTENLRLEKYKCAANKWTIGYGHALQPEENYTLITKEEAEKIFSSDIRALELGVDRVVLVELTQGQFDALISLVYNWGIGNFLKSKGLKALNSGDYNNARTEFFEDTRLMSVRDKNAPGGLKVLGGLVKRRAFEKALFDGLSFKEASSNAEKHYKALKDNISLANNITDDIELQSVTT